MRMCFCPHSDRGDAMGWELERDNQLWYVHVPATTAMRSVLLCEYNTL